VSEGKSFLYEISRRHWRREDGPVVGGEEMAEGHQRYARLSADSLKRWQESKRSMLVRRQSNRMSGVFVAANVTYIMKPIPIVLVKIGECHVAFQHPC
jgi:hypothetical protein